MSTVLPMGCARCGAVRRQHDADDHRWISPTMRTVLARAEAWRKQVAA
ncbi:hypothetical protein ABZ793_12065 [Micromonospora sp. NPDC047465]